MIKPGKLNDFVLLFVALVLLTSCQSEMQDRTNINSVNKEYSIALTIDEANRLAALPMDCIQNPLPYKSGIVIADSSDLKMPQEHHPAFYGCFDWHSAVHGHWSLVYLLKKFPNLSNSTKIRRMLNENLTEANIKKELDYFDLNDYTTSFERTYGWAWLLKLQEELHTWDDPDAKLWFQNISPLAEHISHAYLEYLPKLVYPIRVGEHSNTAFGLSFAYDYALITKDKDLELRIKESTIRFYGEDQDCPIQWEPSGYDFLSPCLQELDIMRKVLKSIEFEKWSKKFLPELYTGGLNMSPGIIKDRSDGKLVHLDGVNFSRAWCLYGLSNSPYAYSLAETHMNHSLQNIVDGDYAGQHWLASFALYAYKCKSEMK